MIEKVASFNVASSTQRIWGDGVKASNAAFKISVTSGCFLSLSFTLFVNQSIRDYIYLYLRSEPSILGDATALAVMIVSYLTAGLLLKFINKHVALITSNLLMLIGLVSISFPHCTKQSPILPQIYVEITSSITYVATFSLLLDLWKDTKPAVFQLLFFTSTVSTGLEMLRNFAQNKITLPGQHQEAELATISFQLMPTIFFLTMHSLFWILNTVLTREVKSEDEECLHSKETITPGMISTSGNFCAPKKSEPCKNWKVIAVGVIVFAILGAINHSVSVKLPIALWTYDSIDYSLVQNSSLIATAASAVSGVLSIIISIFMPPESQIVLHLVIVASSLLWSAIVVPSNLLMLSIGQVLFAAGFFAIRPCLLYIIEKRGHLSSFSISFLLLAVNLGSLVPDLTQNYFTRNKIDLFISLNGLVFNFVIIFVLLLIKKKI